MSDAVLNAPLPIGAVGRRSLGWWGVLSVIATEGALFAYLLFSYFYYAVQLDDAWIPQAPSLRYALPAVIVMVLSSGAIWWATRSITRGLRTPLQLGILVALLLGIAFLVLEGLDWADKPFTLSTSEYSSIYFTITGFHLAHAVAGVIWLLLLLVWSALGYFNTRKHAPVLIAAAYWHFVVVAELAIFLALYVTPYLGGGFARS